MLNPNPNFNLHPVNSLNPQTHFLKLWGPSKISPLHTHMHTQSAQYKKKPNIVKQRLMWMCFFNSLPTFLPEISKLILNSLKQNFSILN